MGKSPKIPDPGQTAAEGIRQDSALQPFNYLVQAASTLGVPITLDGKTYDFSGKGQADVAGRISDQMASTLLALQREKDPVIIQQRLNELKAADPKGYAARQQLFDRIMTDARSNPDRPVATELQSSIHNELAKGAGFDDARQEQQVRDQARGDQVASGIYRGNAATSDEAKQVVSAGESLRNQREQNALNLLQSGSSPEDVAYRRFQQNLANLGAFQTGETPEAQFQQVSGAANGPVQLTGQSPSTNTFNPNAAGQGLNNGLGIYSGQWNWAQSQANPWLAGLGTTANTFSTVAKINPSWFGGSSGVPSGSVGFSGGGGYWTPGAGSNSGWDY